MIFRGMKKDNSIPTVPMCGSTATASGARPNTDIFVVDGIVEPNTGGMSVSNNLESLPPHPIPKRLERLVESATGPNTMHVWMYNLGIKNDVRFQDLSLKTKGQKVQIEPSKKMSFEEFQKKLHGTKMKFETNQRKREYSSLLQTYELQRKLYPSLTENAENNITLT